MHKDLTICMLNGKFRKLRLVANPKLDLVRRRLLCYVLCISVLAFFHHSAQDTPSKQCLVIHIQKFGIVYQIVVCCVFDDGSIQIRHCIVL